MHVLLNYINSEDVILRSTYHGWSLNCKAAVTSALHVVVEGKVRVS